MPVIIITMSTVVVDSDYFALGWAACYVPTTQRFYNFTYDYDNIRVYNSDNTLYAILNCPGAGRNNGTAIFYPPLNSVLHIQNFNTVRSYDLSLNQYITNFFSPAGGACSIATDGIYMYVAVSGTKGQIDKYDASKNLVTSSWIPGNTSQNYSPRFMICDGTYIYRADDTQITRITISDRSWVANWITFSNSGGLSTRIMPAIAVDSTYFYIAMNPVLISSAYYGRINQYSRSTGVFVNTITYSLFDPNQGGDTQILVSDGNKLYVQGSGGRALLKLTPPVFSTGNVNPNITKIQSIANGLVVSYTGSSNDAYPIPYYYYSVNGAVFANTGLQSNSANITITNLFVAGDYSVQIMAVNKIGNLVSGNVVGNPYVLGNVFPNITQIYGNNNTLTVYFTGSVGYPAPYYYYSVNGGGIFANSGVNSANANITIPNLPNVGNYVVRLMAVNLMGNLVSGNATGVMYSLGNALPNITSVQRALNSLIVSFTGSVGAYTSPFYYYSVNGNAFANSGINSANVNIVIPNLTVAGNYSVQLMAVNPVGSLYSGNAYGSPYLLGNTNPNITQIQRTADSLIVSFTGVVGADPEPYYYYSVNGTAFANTGLQSNANITIPVLANKYDYSVRIMAVNPAGNVVTANAYPTPYVVGSMPNIISVYPTYNGLSVSFYLSAGGDATPLSYYYSTTGNLVNSVYTLFNATGTTSNTFVIPYFQANANISIMARNYGGNVYSATTVIGNPYLVGNAYGGTFSRLSTYYVGHVFTNGSGNISFPVDTTANVLIVGGGGGGGCGINSKIEFAGGGGAGGVGIGTITFKAGVVYNITAGSGGAGGKFLSAPSTFSISTNGGNSSISGGSVSEIAYGGGFGACAGQVGGRGGSGGGAHSGGPATEYAISGSATTGKGNLLTYFGFEGKASVSSTTYGGGGGGGAGEVGGALFQYGGARGGNGIAWGVNGMVYGGGGGGSAAGTGYLALGYGGTGGGGNGAGWLTASKVTLATSGTPNTGGGGGGTPSGYYGQSYSVGNLNAGNGGSGIIVIALPAYSLGEVAPNINSVASGANTLIINFTGSIGAAPIPYYYYSVNGTAFANSGFTSNTNAIVVPNLTVYGNYTLQIMAVNSVGNVYSSNSFGFPYVLGNALPNITQIQSNANSLIVSFTGSVGAYPDPYYYYSVNGNAYANTGSQNANAIFIPNLYSATPYSINIMAVNRVGNLRSGNVSAIPYVLGNALPNITKVQSGANSLIVSFAGAQNAYPEPYYYYSVNGSVFSNAGINAANANIVITGLTTNGNYRVQLLAVNPAGNLQSGNSFGFPYVLGNALPNITGVQSLLNSVRIFYTGSVGANPQPYYYYSVDGNAYANSGINFQNSNILIPNLNSLGPYKISIMAVNPAGYIESASANAYPYILGSQPNILSVAPMANGISISFQPSLGGYPAPIYYYSLNGNVATSFANAFSNPSANINLSANTLVIGNLFSTTNYNIYLLAQSAAGNVYSDKPVSAQSFTLGTAPVIANVYSNLNSLIVQFNATVGGNPAPYYYYSVNGSVAVPTGLTTNTSNILIPNLTVANVYTVQLIAVNAAGNLESNKANGQPYILGSNPNIISVAPLANGLSVSFQSSVGGYPAPVYYYSLDGGNAYTTANIISQTANTLVIGNLFATRVYSVSVGAVSVAGNVYSDSSVVAQPYTLGTVPVIANVYSNLNSLIVQFNASTGGYPTPYYYYSVSGQAAANTGLISNASTILIPNLTVANIYSVQIIAVNPAGNLGSNKANGQPYIVGTQPNIYSVTSQANAISVSFQESVGGYPTPPYYYYSLDGGNTYSNANIISQTTGVIVIGNLYTSTVYSVSLVAVNAAGNAYSASIVEQRPYSLGTAGPNITNIYSGVNSLLVQITGSVGAYPPPYYYYSVNGGVFSNTGNTSSAANIIIGSITQANTYSVRIMAVNPAGNVVSNSATGQPYVLGSNPNIISVAPLANGLSVSFQPSVGGYDAPAYYYSINGNVAGSYLAVNIVGNANSFVIGGLTANVAVNVSLLAFNSAGNVYSATTMRQTPYVLGNSLPTILNVFSNVNSLSVSFAAVLNANPPPFYYYSVDGSVFSNSGLNSNSALLFIPNITVLGNHSVQLMAVNPAGNVASNKANGQPFLLGSNPNIISVAPLANGVSVSFQPSVGGYDTPVYYYSVSGNVAGSFVSAGVSGDANSFVIGGLTANVEVNVSVLAKNSAGNVYSATTMRQTPYVLGNSLPTILNVFSNVNSLSVSFAAVLNANPPPFYYYSVDGSGFSNSGLNSNSAPLFIPNITVLGNHSVQLMAVNPAGNVASNKANGQPFLLGSNPNIISVAPLANGLSVSFHPSVGGYTEPVYYYSISGNTAYVAAGVSGNANSFVIGGLTVNAEANVSVLAKNAAGNVYSATTARQTPYVLGTTAPYIFDVSSGLNSLSVSFSAVLNANPAPFYYYSVDGSVFSNSGQNGNGSTILITNITATGSYNVQLMAVNPAGNVASNYTIGQPLTIGSNPNIISVAPLANGLSVSFQASVGGYPAPTYYYSLNGNVADLYVAANIVGNANSFVIGGLTANVAATVSVLAVNSAGNVYSATTVRQTPYVLGNAGPDILQVYSEINSLSVSFAAALNANPAPFYYYSVDGRVFSNSGLNSNASNIVIPNLTVAKIYSVSIMASNPAGNVATGNLYGQPYTNGTQPNIIDVSGVANGLSVSFQAVSGWYPEPTYYYSINGNVAGSYVLANIVGNNLTIPNLFTLNSYSVSLLAINIAGNVYSANTVAGQPYVLGTTAPNIKAVLSAAYSLVVVFDRVIGANPQPYYYYSVDGNVFSNSGLNSNTSNIVIPNLTVARNYSVTIMASNPAGNVLSGNSYGIPYVVGTQPNIISVDSLANAISISFQTSVGYPAPTYYYSLNGNSYIATGLNANANSFVVGNLFTNQVYNVSMLATNSAGNSYSDKSVVGRPYVLGTAPAITSVVGDLNSVIVYFSGSTGAYPSPYYYYSVDGGEFANSGANSNISPITVSNLTLSKYYTITLLAVSPAGNLISGNASGKPATPPTPPIITVDIDVNRLLIYWTDIPGDYVAPYKHLYSLDGVNYVDDTTNVSPIIVSGLTSANSYSVSLKSVNSVGASNPSNVVVATPYGIGRPPIIYSLTPIANGLIVDFSGSIGGKPEPSTYYYSVDGVDYIDGGFSTSPGTITNLSPVRIYPVSLKALNAAGITEASTPVPGSPFIEENAPIITNVAKNNSELTISYIPVQTQVIYPSPIVYFYSLNGSRKFESVNNMESPIVVSGVSEDVATVAIKGVIEITSESFSYPGRPYIIGFPPTINSVESIYNGLIIDFSGGFGGYPEITNYYYSLDNGNSFVDANTTASPITIVGLTKAIRHSIVLIAQNLVGNTNVSNMVEQTPYVDGSTPVITNVSSGPNSLVVEFHPSEGGWPVPDSYYYSIDEVNYFDSGSSESRLIVPNLTTPGTNYGVSIKSHNKLGFSPPSNRVFGRPYVAGYPPQIIRLQSSFQQISVEFLNNGSYPVPTQYYYSVDGANFMLATQKASPLLIEGLTSNSRYNVFIYSVNVAGASPVSRGLSIWTKSSASFFGRVLNPSYRPFEPIYSLNQPNNVNLNNGEDQTRFSSKRMYSQYVRGTGTTRK